MTYSRGFAALLVTLGFVLPLAAPGSADRAAGSAPARVRPPAVVARFAVSGSTHDNMAKPVLLSDGRILALSIFTRGRHQDMMGRYSTDGGDPWTGPQVLFSLPEHVGGFGYFNAFTDRDGEVHIFYLNDGNTGEVLPKPADDPPVRSGSVLDIWQVKSAAKATRWAPAKPIWTGRAGDVMSVIQLKSGRILLPISHMTARSWSQRGDGFKAFTYVGSFSSSAIYSDDGGNTWRQSRDELTVPTPDLFAIGGVEPVVIEHVFNLPIDAVGRILNITLAPNRWHELELTWDTARRDCTVAADGKRAGVLRSQRVSAGINYLRFHVTADAPDGGLLAQSVGADVSASWPASPNPPAASSANALEGRRSK